MKLLTLVPLVVLSACGSPVCTTEAPRHELMIRLVGELEPGNYELTIDGEGMQDSCSFYVNAQRDPECLFGDALDEDLVAVRQLYETPDEVELVLYKQDQDLELVEVDAISLDATYDWAGSKDPCGDVKLGEVIWAL